MTNQGRNGIDVVLAESLKELSETRPIEKITIKEITDKAGVIRPTFYNHFQDKYELLEWIVREELMKPAMPLFNNGMLREGLTFILTTMEREKSFYAKAVRLEGQNSFPEMLLSCAKEIVLTHMDYEAARKKVKYDWVSPGWLAEYYGHSACLMLMQWIKNGMQEPVNEVIDVYLTLAQEPMLDILR
jgi:probable dihydroxyacetone kinase regulator